VRLRTTLYFACGLLIVAMIGSFLIAGWFDHRKHTLSGVPGSHFALNENGRCFYVPRGGPPIEQRPQVPMTAEQYGLYKENEQLGSLWAGRAGLCFLAAAGIAVWLKMARSGRTNAGSPSRPNLHEEQTK
jgi:hypothetical protein